VAGSTSQNSSIKSTTSRSAGKLYFEVKLEGVATNLCIVGIAAASTATTGYPGADSVSWGIVAGGGAVYNNAGVLGTASPVPISGNTLGVAVDFTASTGSIKFYAANSLGYTVSSLTLGASYIMAGYSCAATAQKVLLCTTAQQCAYTPPSGYSYWDS
jgi:hypothetical protein